MKTVALAANGEGFGHASRLVSLVEALNGHYKLVIYAPESIHEFIHEKLSKQGKLPYPLRTLPCPAFVKQGDSVKYLATIKKNLPLLLSLRKNAARIRLQLIKDAVDILISDFEPFSTWGAKSLGIPVLQINHPGIVIRSKSLAIDAILAKTVAWLMMGWYDSRILVSFYDGDCGPIIRKEIMTKTIKNKGHIVVYIKKEYQKKVVAALEDEGYKNILVFPNPQADTDFAEALASCTAVIASAGHQIISECLYLRKPLLVIPQRGQFEQRLNAIKLEKSGFGTRTTMRSLKYTIRKFIDSIDLNILPKYNALFAKTICIDDNTDYLLRCIIKFIESRNIVQMHTIASQLLSEWLVRRAE
jgi:uncharacterized protein (TIGR00661 family)